jgi:hypothetical protein
MQPPKEWARSYRLQELLDTDFKKITKQDYDGFTLITGDEGKGKSNLMMHMLERWNYKLFTAGLRTEAQVAPEEIIKKVSLRPMDFLNNVANASRFDMIVYDEAGELSNKRSMSIFNHILNKIYMAIRGLNLYTVMVIPSIFDIDGYFSKHRTKHLFHVKRRGDASFYNKEKVRRILDINRAKIVKSVDVERKLWDLDFIKYDGVILPPYMVIKEQKIQEIKKEGVDEFNKMQAKGEPKPKKPNPYIKKNWYDEAADED